VTSTIPFVPKRPDGPRPWAEFGATETEYLRWAPHVCSIACCRSLILAARGEAPSLWSLTKRGIELGVFVETGIGIAGAFHVPLVALLKEFRIGAVIFGGAAEAELWRNARRHPIMLSIDLARAGSGATGSHLVLVTGRSSIAYQVLDNACVLSGSGTVVLPRMELAAISNEKGLLITGMLGVPASG